MAARAPVLVISEACLYGFSAAHAAATPGEAAVRMPVAGEPVEAARSTMNPL